MGQSITVFVRAASVAVFLDLYWTVSTVWLGNDAAGRSAKLLGVAVAVPFAFLVALPLMRRPSRGKNLIAMVLFFAGGAAALLVSASPYEAVDRYPVGWASGTGPTVTALWLGAALVLPLAGAFQVLAAGTRHPAPVVAGLAVGLVVQELVLLGAFGWIGSGALWAGLFFVATLATGGDRRPDPISGEDRSVFPSVTGGIPPLLAGLLFAVLVGASFSIARYFLKPHLSSTRFTEVTVVSVGLLGISLGSVLAGLAGLRHGVSGWLRALVFVPAVFLGAAAPVYFLMRLAARGEVARFEQGQFLGAALVEVYVVLGAVSVGSVLLGIALRAFAVRPVVLSVIPLGFWLGSLQPVELIPPAQQIRLLASWARSDVFDFKLTEEGLLTHNLAFDKAPQARVHWNRDPISRIAEWADLEREEIFLPARRALSRRQVLVHGTVFASHREAIPDSAFEIIDYLDPVPPFFETGTPRGDETDPWRFLARSEGKGYDVIVSLSRPVLTAGDGLLFSHEVLSRLDEFLAEDGKLFVWVDLRAFGPDGLDGALRTFFSRYRTGNLWLSQDGLAGPLLCLESKTDAPAGSGEPGGSSIRLLTGSTLLPRLEAVPVSTFERPVLELGLPLSPTRFSSAAPATLRRLRDRLSPDPDDHRPVWYLLEGLALHEAELVAPESRFAGPGAWIQVSTASVKVMTEGLRRFPDFPPLAQVLSEVGWALFARTDYELLMELLPVWLEACPDRPEFLTLMGSLHAELLDHELALPYLERAAALEPDSKRVLEALGRVYSGLEFWPEAVGVYTVLYGQDPENLALARELGLASYRAGDLEEARRLLDGVSLDYPNDEEVRRALEDLNGQGDGSP